MWGDKMRVYWFGHAFFKIVVDDKIICIDPYDESIGYIAPKDIFLRYSFRNTPTTMIIITKVLLMESMN